MPPIRSVAILLHERDGRALESNYRLWAIAANWRRRGIRVELVHGLSRQVDADLLVPHIELSYIPDDYWGVIQGHPNVVNRAVRDIRKTRISTNLVRRGDPVSGPVIVKTAGNCGGFADQWFGPAHRPSLLSRARTRLGRVPWIEPRSFRWARTLSRYYIYESVAQVPRAAFGNPHLVVERFLPEPHPGGYILRMWNVFGTRSLGRTLVSPDPYVKNTRAVLGETGDPPPEIIEARRRLGLDYGKMDYVIHDGRGVLIDVNTTPTVSGDAHSEEYRASCADLAEGLEWFEQERR